MRLAPQQQYISVFEGQLSAQKSIKTRGDVLYKLHPPQFLYFF